MKRTGLSRTAATLLLALAPAACGGQAASTPPGGLGVDRARGAAISTARKGEDLVYASNYYTIFVVSYRTGRLVAKIPGVSDVDFLCSDARGNVFATRFGNHDVLEYAHGGTKPIADLDDSGAWPWSCAVDPLTGNLAVINLYDNGDEGAVRIFPGAQGSSHTLRDPAIQSPVYGTYDDRGNLYVDGVGLDKAQFAEVPAGTDSFVAIALSQRTYGSDVLQWDGKYVVDSDPIAKVIYQFSISGASGTVAGTVKLSDWYHRAFREFWLYGDTIVTQPGRHRELGYWSYPQGGSPRNVYSDFARKQELTSVTVSVAPK